MRTIAIVVAFAASCGLAGCQTRPSASPTSADAEFGGWSWYALNQFEANADDVGVSASWGSWNKKFVYVILSDVATTADTTINSTDTRTEYKVVLTLPKDLKADLRIETADGITGSAVYGGQSFDLAQGSVFVLMARGEKTELRQLKRDISGLTAGVPAVQKLVLNDPEIIQIFAKVK